jgi:hypothetical protein
MLLKFLNKNIEFHAMHRSRVSVKIQVYIMKQILTAADKIKHPLIVAVIIL